jgi:hypothetical protein
MKANDVKKIILVGMFLSHKPMIAINSTKMINLIIFIKINLGNIIKKVCIKAKKG